MEFHMMAKKSIFFQPFTSFFLLRMRIRMPSSLLRFFSFRLRFCFSFVRSVWQMIFPLYILAWIHHIEYSMFKYRLLPCSEFYWQIEIIYRIGTSNWNTRSAAIIVAIYIYDYVIINKRIVCVCVCGCAPSEFSCNPYTRKLAVICKSRAKIYVNCVGLLEFSPFVCMSCVVCEQCMSIYMCNLQS